MADLSSQEKRIVARKLYTEGRMTQAEVAETMKVSRQTIVRWAKDDKWDQLRAGLTTTKEEQIGGLYRQIAAINDAIATRDEKERFPSPKEADTLVKLSTSIKNMEGDIGISDVISVGMRFLNHLRHADMEKAKEFTRLFDVFLRDSM